MDGWKEFDHTIVGETNSSITERVRACFALVAHTGIIAIKAGILPWTERQVVESVKACYSAWHSGIDTVSDVARGIDNVRNFILAHESRFQSINHDIAPINRAGWFREKMHHFTPLAFKEACKGVDVNKVKKELKTLGFHFTSKSTGLVNAIKVNRSSTNIFSVKALMSALSKIWSATKL